MNANLLIDHIVRQTTVLIAQLSTASGIRAPLAHVANQVFVQLALEIENQGVSRKVVADMFGMALRSYQRKVQRLGEDTEPGTTLWHSVLTFLEETGPCTRTDLLERFKYKDEAVVLAVVNDLVGMGLAYRSGKGDSVVLGVVPKADIQKLLEREQADALEGFVWLTLFHEPGQPEATFHERFADRQAVQRALDTLVADGRVRREERDGEKVLTAGPFFVPIGTAKGWEAAVFDHFLATTAAIVAKLRNLGPRSAAGDVVGGSTIHFGVHEGHPHREEVLGTLARVRKMMDEQLEKVTVYNREHPVSEDLRTRVTFYFGQYLVDPASASATNGEETP